MAELWFWITAIRWIVSVPLLLAGAILSFASLFFWSSMALMLVNQAIREGHTDYSTSLIPPVGGILVFLGVLIVPIDLPAHRLLCALVLSCVDLSMLWAWPMLIVWFLRGSR